MRVAVGTATVMLAATAFAGFAGHALHGGFDPALAVPCGVAAVAGGLAGGRLALKAKPKNLRLLSGVITILAAAVMMANALAGE